MRSEEYEKKAEEMEARANREPLGLIREEYLNLAKHWRSLAASAREQEKRGR